jgi:hypothetical protein
VFLAGCNKGGSSNTVPVEGKVTLDNKPLTSGTVYFLKEGKGSDPPATVAFGDINSEGVYTVKTQGKPGAPTGHYKVTVSAAPPAGQDPGAMVGGGKPPPPGGGAPPVSPIPRKYGEASSTPLTVDVPGNYDLALKH